MQFIRVENGQPVGSPQSFSDNVAPSSDWKFYKPNTEDYNPLRSALVDVLVPDAPVVVQVVVPFPEDVCARLDLEDLRETRNKLLAESDWTRMDDNGLDDDDRELWAIYRQELRDLPTALDGIESLDDVVWPESP